MKITFNGKPVRPGQLGRELEKSMLAAVEKQIKGAAPTGVRVRRTANGYEAEGDKAQIDRMIDRLSK